MSSEPFYDAVELSNGVIFRVVKGRYSGQLTVEFESSSGCWRSTFLAGDLIDIANELLKVAEQG